MKIKRASIVLATGMLMSLGVLAAEQPTAGTTTGEMPTERTSLTNEIWGLRPQVGFMNYSDTAQTSYSEMNLAVLGEINALKLIDVGLDSDRFFIGPEAGLTFSHLSISGANFFTVPLNLKAGYLITPRLRAGVHGGAALAYRTTANAMRFSTAPETATASANIYPNVGLDVDWAITNDLALTVRPDFLITPGSTVFSAGVGVVLPFA